jgi:hypothetical protein
MQLHAMHMAWKRYKIPFTPALYEKLKTIITSGRTKYLKRESPSRTREEVIIHGRPVHVVWDWDYDFPATFLTINNEEDEDE